MNMGNNKAVPEFSVDTYMSIVYYFYTNYFSKYGGLVCWRANRLYDECNNHLGKAYSNFDSIPGFGHRLITFSE